jgi:hypothetical protein
MVHSFGHSFDASFKAVDIAIAKPAIKTQQNTDDAPDDMVESHAFQPFGLSGLLGYCVLFPIVNRHKTTTPKKIAITFHGTALIDEW